MFLADDLVPAADGLDVGDAAHLGGPEGRHAGGVRRVSAGEHVDLVDGRGLRLGCETTGATEAGIAVVVRSRVQEAAPAPRLTLVQALAKGGRDEQAVEAATEVGVDDVVPWQSDRCVVRWSGPRAARGRARWQGVALAAAKQSRRAWVPSVAEAVGTRALTAWVRGVVDEGGVCLVCHEEGTRTLSDVLADGELHGADRVVLVVGPEGGIAPDELDALRGAGARVVLLGPHVLRSSTAGPVAAALVSVATGRW